MEVKAKSAENKQFIDKFSYVINKDNYSHVLDGLYRYMKMETEGYYKDGHMLPEYNSVLEALLFVEETSHYRKVFNFDMPVLYNDDKRPDNYLDKLVFDARREIIKFHDRKKIDTNQIDYTNKCITASQEVLRSCIDDGIKAYIIKIYPGFKKGNIIESDLNCHYFNIVFYNNKAYLVDLTYAQFFHQEKNVFNRLGVVGLDGCGVGAYMMQNEKTKSIVEKIIKDGYIQLNEDIFKTYLDAFTLSFRNGLYYENNDITCFDVDYTVDDYLKFFRGEDNQINREGLENLGKQRKPLKNHEIDFNIFVK